MSKKPLKSIIPAADQSEFSLENLPFGVFTHTENATKHVGVRLGDYVIDLGMLEKNAFFDKIKETTSKDLNSAQRNTKNTSSFASQEPWFIQNSLNHFASQGQTISSNVRQRIQDLFSLENTTEYSKNSNHHNTSSNNLISEDTLKQALIPIKNATMHRPFDIPGFTDFYACEQHAINVGCLFRSRENALMPNWKRLPVAYNGRASTVFVSGHPIRRPKGQILLPEQEAPIYTACRKLDFELEMGIFIGTGNPDAARISVSEAPSHIFGLVMLNDWSARDIQSFEYQPLGPFLSKSFGTSISPWVVTLDALKPFMMDKADSEVPVVEYLQQTHRKQPNVQLKVEIQPANSDTRTTVCHAPYSALYWTMEQMLAHHTVNNCIMQTGDLLGTGTISGPERENFGSFLEITENGKIPFALPNGQERRFLEDGDTLFFTAYCKNDDVEIGFGELSGTILPAF
jgi:fumarylacetoacetase